ncbi:MAG: hypothetical protein JXL97_17160 [Bacteroidales bacterium]|nr:hypothetical protein [Bacteroidales bacterium]
MKTKLFIFLVFLTCVNIVAKSQSIDDVPFLEINTEYMKIIGTNEYAKSTIVIRFDFGGENKSINKNKNIIKDENGNILKFTSMIDALNFMSKNGYEYVDSYTTRFGDFFETNYILKKKQE